MYKLLLLIFVSLTTSFSFAAQQQRTLFCYVVNVSDGDTLTCALKNNKKLKVRLAEIDAPEKKQRFGIKSQQLLAKLVHKTEVKLVVQGYDRYQRMIAMVYDQRNRNVNLLMVQRGMAWAYKRHSKNSLYLQAEQQAKKKRVGLWQDPKPMLPAEWREKQRQANKPTDKKRER